MTTIIIEAVGWLAALLILAAYAMLTVGKLEAQSRAYHWLNVLGAAGFIVNSGWNEAFPSAALNVVWAGIGLAALWRIAHRKGSSTSAT